MAVSLQKAGSINQDIGLVGLECAALLDLHLPLPRFIVPDGFLDARVELNVPGKVVFFHSPLDVLLNFGAGSIKVRPIRIGFEQKCVGI